MNRSIQFDADGDRNFQVLWKDDERVFCRRHANNGNRSTVLAVLPAEEHPTPAALNRLAHEYGLKDELDGAWAVRPLGLISEDGRTMLLLEDLGGEPLERLLGAPMEVGCFLHLAIAIAKTVTQVHRSGLIHKDIKPANILLDAATGGARLTGFGIASRLARERQSPDPPETIAGTLAYMAPEQTGRMNRSIDSRSDLYALGVTFYQMLTGSPPFNAADPMEWVHCHIARKPLPPSERSNIPAPVSEIIMKLLAKTAEERYQTAAGVESDLRHCLAERERKGRIDPFALGEHDASDRLLLPEKLYGRSREIETLLACFDRIVNDGAVELVLVSGYSGIGKSSVVNELHKALVPPRGLYASGKFDQYKRDIPYSTLAQAFQSLIRPLLGKNDLELAGWREAFREALGPNGRLIIDLVPELKHIVGDQPPVPELPPHDAQRRLQLVLRRFLAVFARPEHPLALFLDDLQWLDSATLDLLEDLLTQPDVQHLMLIGAYRDNEVNSAHPLIRKLEAIRKAGAVVHEIILAPLAREDMGRLIGDALHCEPGRITALAELIHEKTAGNPFFANQLISVLFEEGLLTFDYGEGRWLSDLNSIRAKGYTDNVVDLLVHKLNRLPVETQEALQLLACMGNSAEFARLEMVSQQSDDKMHGQLWEALRLGLIVRTAHSYTFLHDRVQQAAYSLIPEEARAEAHLRIGRLLATHVAPTEREEAIFEIVNQLNRGGPLITSQDEREKVAELNLIAGRRAKASSAYASALTYLTAGAALLRDDAWERRQDLAFALELHRADCELWTGALPSVEERLAALAARAVDTVQRAAVASRRVDLYTMLGASNRAVEVGLEFLRYVGIDWPAHPTEMEARREYERIWSQLGSRAIEDLIDLPLMQDPESLATLDVLTNLANPASFTDQNLWALITFRAFNVSLERGNSDAAPAHYSAAGLQACLRFGDYDAGYRLAKVACDLTERRGLKRFGGKTYLNFAMVIPWTRPVRERIEPTRRAFQMANEQGDPTYAAYASRNLVSTLFSSGDPLDQVEREAEHGLEFARTVRFGFSADMISAPLALVRTLRGKAARFGSLDAGGFTERSFEERLTDHPTRALPECFYWIRKLQARFLAGDYASAIEAAKRAERWFSMSASPSIFLPEMAEYHLYAALSRAACCEPMVPDPYAEHREALAAHDRQLRAWAANCPENFEDRAALVGAEIARIERRELDAERLYEQAIGSARANGFIHNEALAYELAARFYAARGFKQIADLYLRNARYGYLRWGAVGKVQQLDGTYPDLRQEDSLPGPASTIGAPVEHLDLATVIKVSQAVSSEIVLENLIDTLMHTAMEQAGAERALLILPRGQEPRIEAEATTSGDTVTVRLIDDAVTQHVLPDSVLHYVLRTREIVILDDATAQSPFGVDPYICQRQARSILCLPLLNRAKLIGVLYLENNLTPRVFAPARISALRLLASQAAIALENARLYRDAGEREEKIRRSESYLAEAQRLSHTGTWFLDARTMRYLYWSDEAYRIWGFDPLQGDPSRENMWQRIHPDDRDRVWEEVQEALRQKRDFSSEFRLLLPDGTMKYLEAATYHEFSSSGALAGAVSTHIDVTGRKRTEEALRESEAKIQRLVDSNIIGIMIWDFDGRILEANDEFLRMVGYDRDDLLSGRIWWTDLTPPDWRDRNNTRIEQQKSSGRFEPFEKEYTRKDGSRVPVLIGGATFEEGGNQVVAFVLDLTERKRAEERLRVQHTVTQILAEAATIEEVTPRILRAMGECLGWDVGALWRVTREAEALRCVALWHKASIEVPEFERVSREFTFVPGLGLPGRVCSSLEPEYIPDVVSDENFPRGPIAEREGLHAAFGFPILLEGEPLGVIEFFSREIRQPDQELLNMLATIGSQIGQFIERKRAEAELRESEQNYRMLFESIDEGFCTIEVLFDQNEKPVDYRFLQISPSFERQTGIKNAAGRRMREIAPQHEEHWFEIYGRIALTGEPMRFENEAKQLGRWYDVYAFRVEDPKRRRVGILFNDITERKRAEAEVRDSERRYREAQLDLAHANRVATMGQLTASITHEVNQPITAAVTYALAARRYLSAEPPNFREVDDALSLIVKEGNRAGEVVGRIRALIKKAPARKDAVEINDAILEVIALTRTEAAKNSVSVRTQFAEGLPRVQGDRVQLQQVLLNLTINAIQAMRDVGEGERELLISTRSEADGVCVEVRDSGPGIAPAALERVFEAFYTTKPSGLGLGLSICRSIIEAHNGRLWASANLPRGASFQFALPAIASTAS